MINGKGNRFVPAGVGDFYEKNGNVIVLRPRGNLCGISAIRLDQIFYKLVEEAMLPSDKNSGIPVFGRFKLALQPFDFSKTEFCIDRQAHSVWR